MRAIIFGTLVSGLLASAGLAQDYPTGPITIVVPFAAGGPTDTVTRLVAEPMSKALGQQVLVQNVGGAGGTLGATQVAKAKPDGYTLLLHHIGMSTAPSLYKDLAFDPVKDFAPIGLVTNVPMTIVARKDFEPDTLAELVDYARKNPEKINYATIGQGSTHHILAELFQREAGIKMTHIPYKGASPALTDFLGGTIDLFIDYQLGIAPLVDSGKIIALAVASEQRVSTMPKTPTFAEQGYKTVVVSAFTIVLAPADTPQPVMDKLVSVFPEVLKDPELEKYYADRGSQMMIGYGPTELKKFLDEERAKTKKMIELSGLQPE